MCATSAVYWPRVPSTELSNATYSARIHYLFPAAGWRTGVEVLTLSFLAVRWLCLGGSGWASHTLTSLFKLVFHGFYLFGFLGKSPAFKKGLKPSGAENKPIPRMNYLFVY